MKTSEDLDAWSCGGWGVFIALNHQEAIREGCWRRAHRTVRCATGQVLFTVQCAATSPNRYGLEPGRPLEALSSCGTGQSGATPNRSCSLSGASLTLWLSLCACCCFSSSFCSRPLHELVVALLAHRTVRWHTEQSGEL
jgi:hypothetical protein